MILFVILNFLNNIINKLLKGFTMKKFLSKKILMPISLMAMILAFNNTQQAHAQEKGRIMFWAEDAVGNRDTVWFVIHPEATEGVDTALGEVNLYGVEPQGDLDLRIIRRSDTNYWLPLNVPEEKRKPYWLVNIYNPAYHGDPNYIDGGNYARSASGNFDFKTEYLGNYSRGIGIPLKIVSENYPITINLEMSKKSVFYDSDLVWSYFEDEDGSKMGGYLYPYMIMYCPDTVHNYIFIKNPIYTVILFEFGRHVSIKDEIIKKTLYPNPATNMVVLEDCNFGDEYQVVNINGIIIKIGIIDNEDCVIDISELLTSTYFIKTNNYFYKLIKEKK